MATNERRGTPGRLLMAWSYLLVICVLFSWRVKIHRFSARPEDSYEVPIYPSALGDTRYYTPQGLADFFAPNVTSFAHPKGLYRRMHQPVRRDDATMLKVDTDGSATGPWLYYDAKRHKSPEGLPLPARFYLKTGENLYIEFGAQNFWPAFEAPRAIPFVPPPGSPQ